MPNATHAHTVDHNHGAVRGRNLAATPGSASRRRPESETQNPTPQTPKFPLFDPLEGSHMDQRQPTWTLLIGPHFRFLFFSFLFNHHRDIVDEQRKTNLGEGRNSKDTGGTKFLETLFQPDGVSDPFVG